MLPNIAVILTNQEKRILWVNDDFTKITGYTFREVLGKSPSLLQGPGSDRQAIARIRQRLRDQVAFKDQVLNYRKNGEEYLCRLVIHPVFNNDRQLTNYIAFEIDGNLVAATQDPPILRLENKYSSSSLKGFEEITLYRQLVQLLQEEKLYLDPNLTLRGVADRMATNTKYLSQVVNRHSGKNFQFFINAFRVSEAKEKIAGDDFKNLTLYGIALQCGFKNKSTFYKVFKEVSGQTPREFLQSQ